MGGEIGGLLPAGLLRRVKKKFYSNFGLPLF